MPDQNRIPTPRLYTEAMRAYPAENRAEMVVAAANIALIDWRTWLIAIPFISMAFITNMLIGALIKDLFSFEINKLGHGAISTAVLIFFFILWIKIWSFIVRWVLIYRKDAVLKAYQVKQPSSKL